MTAGPDPVAYLDAAAGTAVGVAYRQRLMSALDLRAGQVVADIGCVPGTDLSRLAEAVGAAGSVIGVDHDPGMVRQARHRLAHRPTVALCQGDVHGLPLAGGSVDRARVDRVLQHVRDPAAAIAEVCRVLRPGGLFGMAEPDWDTLAVADEDLDTSRRFARFVAGRVRNPTVGRQLVRLSAGAGLRIRSVDPVVALFRDFGTADQILGLSRNTARAVRAGAITETDADAWLRRLAAGPLVASFTFYLVVADAPRPHGQRGGERQPAGRRRHHDERRGDGPVEASGTPDGRADLSSAG